jgi:hypothetical protein
VGTTIKKNWRVHKSPSTAHSEWKEKSRQGEREKNNKKKKKSHASRCYCVTITDNEKNKMQQRLGGEAGSQLI